MSRAEIERYLAHLRAELDGAALYGALAEAERDARVAAVYRRLAAVEEGHAAEWLARLRAENAAIPPFRLSWRVRTLIWLTRRFGAGLVLPTIRGWEQRDSRAYRSEGQGREIGMAADEESHARLLRQIRGATRGGLEGGFLARLEGRHRAGGGNALRAAVLGANDGIVSNLSLVMGVAGANLPGQATLIAGLAGLLAGASAMAMGEWLSVQSSRELYEHQLEAERAEIASAPEEETEELALIYEAKGLEAAQARELAGRMMSDEARALDTLAREELGLDPETLGGSPWEAALTSFVLFALGAIVPVSSFVFLTGPGAVVVSLLASAVALFAMGAAITLFTGRPAAASGGRQVVFGLAAAALTFGVGRLIGVSIGG